ncbi:hypothetical protein [Zoogloea sp.]|uniref:hypothetical protein n=1 Tax=Zoogloea sp. TaxID=49181 RepID=UPI0035B46FBA
MLDVRQPSQDALQQAHDVVQRLQDRGQRPVDVGEPPHSLAHAMAGDTRRRRAAASPDYDFPDFDENAKATTFYTTGITGLPKGV